MDKFSDNTRLEIFEHAGYFCECRGPGCLGKEGLAPHHRKANTKANRRKYGNEVIQTARNGIALCGHCHINYYWQYKEG